jgi:hypothetical protein
MGEWTTIYRTQHYLFSDIIIEQLEAEGIEAFLLDKITEGFPMDYDSNPRAIQIQVREPDIERATRILLDKGYTYSHREKPNKPFYAIAKLTRKISLFDNMRVEHAIITFVAIVVSIILIIIYIYAKD